jgi:hypothetical protein
MKQIWPNYSYSPTTNVLTLTGLNIDRDQLLLVSAPERGRIMYNFADSSVTASAFTAGANTGLTLVASTAGLTTTASLVIYYDDQVSGISGTVTANIGNAGNYDNGGDSIKMDLFAVRGQDSALFLREGGGNVPVSGTVTVGNTVTIAGTVTANPTGTQTIAGSVTIGAGTAQIGSVTVGNSVTIGSLPAISGTVTANVDAGSLTTALNDFGASYSQAFPVGIDMTGFGNGTVPISGTVTIGSALPAGTNRIGVVTIGAGTVTIGAGTAQIGSVTASLAISSTAITSGSFSSLTSATLVPANTARKMATVYNLGAGQLFVNAGASATTLGGGFMVALSSGDYFECDFTTTTLSAIFATAGTASWVSH